jgi:uncharacterized protein (TIGR00251 family)
MSAATLYRRAGGTGLELRARVTPKAGRDGIDGLVETTQGQALKVRVSAVPEEGAANAALEKVVARWLGVAGGRVRVVRGHKSRVKLLGISGAAAEIEALVAARVAALR